MCKFIITSLLPAVISGEGFPPEKAGQDGSNLVEI